MAMITGYVNMKQLTEDERKIYRGPAKEAAREIFDVDVFDDERLDIEIFLSDQEGNTLPVLRQYVSKGNYMYMLICTDEQLDTMRKLYVDGTVYDVPVDLSEDLMERNIDFVPLKLGEVNCFFTETGVHSLDPIEEYDVDNYILAKKDWREKKYEVISSDDGSVYTISKEDKYKIKREVYDDETSDVLVPIHM